MLVRIVSGIWSEILLPSQITTFVIDTLRVFHAFNNKYNQETINYDARTTSPEETERELRDLLADMENDNG